jgi:hypothetical protein
VPWITSPLCGFASRRPCGTASYAVSPGVGGGPPTNTRSHALVERHHMDSVGWQQGRLCEVYCRVAGGCQRDRAGSGNLVSMQSTLPSACCGRSMTWGGYWTLLLSQHTFCLPGTPSIRAGEGSQGAGPRGAHTLGPPSFTVLQLRSQWGVKLRESASTHASTARPAHNSRNVRCSDLREDAAASSQTRAYACRADGPAAARKKRASSRGAQARRRASPGVRAAAGESMVPHDGA